MSWFRNLSMTPKLIGSFVLVALLAGVVALAGYSGLSSTESKLVGLTQSAPRLIYLLKADGDLTAAMNFTRGSIMTFDKQQAAREAESAQAARENAWAQFASYEALTPTSAEDVKETKLVSGLLRRWMTLNEKTQQLSVSTDVTVSSIVTQLSLVTEAQAEASLSSALHQLVTLNQKYLDNGATQGQSTATTAMQQLVAVGVLAMVLAIVLGVVIAHAIARPLREVSRCSTELALYDIHDLASAMTALSHGDLTVRVSTTARLPAAVSRDEIGQTAEATRLIIDTVRRTINAYEDARQQLQAMVGQVANAASQTEARDLKTTLGAAFALAQIRSDFVASISHELRTPLASIIGYGELLQARWHQMDDVKRLDRINRIVLSANRQKHLVDDLLLLAGLADNPASLQLSPVDVSEAVRHVADEVKGVYAGQRIDLAGPSEVCALADSHRMTLILTNLVDNAAKYSPEGRPISVTWSAEGRTVLVRVRDYGPGIAERDRSHLFTRFGRIPGSRVRSGHVGTGLGLYLGKAYADAMGGTLDLESSGPDGSTFRLQLLIAGSDSAQINAAPST